MSFIYTPKGRAREYAERALNLYKGCSHGCTYCFGPDVGHVQREDFHTTVVPRPELIPKLMRELAKMNGRGELEGHPPVLLCFTCDPYQPLEDELRLTRRAIALLHSYDVPVQVLTKGGKRAERDFDLFAQDIPDATGSVDGDAFAVTLTLIDEDMRQGWEPNAAPHRERVTSLMHAKERGIQTWVSLEPVIDPVQSLQIVHQTYDFVDLFKVGKLNHHPHAAIINWYAFARRVTEDLEGLGARYMLKNDLKKYLSADELSQLKHCENATEELPWQ